MSDDIEKVALARISWAHQRQLRAVAILLGLEIGTIQLLLVSLADVGICLFIFLYIALTVLFTCDLYFVFAFQREIFKWQFRLQELEGSRWEIDFEESLLKFFFDHDNRDMPMRRRRVYPLCVAIFLFLMLLLLLKLSSAPFVLSLEAVAIC